MSKHRWVLSRWGFGLIVLTALFLSVVIAHDNVSAADWSSIKSKAVFEGVYNCIEGGAYSQRWLASKGTADFIASGLDKHAVKLPFGKADVKDNNLNCREVMEGGYKTSSTDELNNGLIGTYGANSDVSSLSKVFAGLGYRVEGVGNELSGNGVSVIMKVSTNGDVGINKTLYRMSCDIGSGYKMSLAEYEWEICLGPDSVGAKIRATPLNNNTLHFPLFDKGSSKYVSDDDTNVPTTSGVYAYALCNSKMDECGEYFTISFDGSDYEVNAPGLLNTFTISDFPNQQPGQETAGDFVFDKTVTDESFDDETYNDYELFWNGDPMEMIKGLATGNRANYTLSGVSKHEDLALSPQEVYDLYSYYVTDVLEIDVICEDEEGFDNYNKKEINWKKGVKCKLTEDQPTIPDNLYGVDRDNYFNAEITTLQDIIDKLDSINLDSINTSGSSTVGSSEDIKETCLNSKGAENMGWIICNVLAWMGHAADDVYTDYVEPSLTVKPELFSGGNEGVRTAWESFRDIANVVFIILLLIVIFSQLTGVGIDNYGIKKILPKMIIAAVLINLSYLFCLLLVDISNILGNGLQSIFTSLGGDQFNSIELKGSAESIEFTTGGSINSALAGVGVLAALIGAVGAIWANPAILLSLFISAVGVVVSIFFLFILLAARKAMIIVLIVLAPLAVVAYMLPNTQKLFDKWWKIFEGLLLVYPIAGLLVGAGDYVSRLLLTTSDGFYTWVTAMVVSVVPVFFIPTVLKGAFGAMGKVGGMLAGMGDRASGVAKQQVRARGTEIAHKVGQTDTFRSARNALMRKSPFARHRAAAVQDTMNLARERSQRERFADRDMMDTRIASAQAAEEAKSLDEATSQRLSLMQSQGIKGKSGGYVPFTIDSARERMEKLADDASTRELNEHEKQELAALARGMAAMTGGGGAMAGIIRDANKTKTNKNFMAAMGEIYARDGGVQAKLNEKDANAAAFTERYMPGAEEGKKPASFSDYQASGDYKKDRSKRVKTYIAGLNQSGEALDEFIAQLEDAERKRIMSDEKLFNSLDIAVQKKLRNYGKKTGPGGSPS